jgi:NADH:ubiquinone oxidoreductase subunit 6 (subunit J)
LGLAVLGLVVFAIMQVIDNPKQSTTSLIGVAGLLIIFFLAFFLATGSDISPVVYEKTGTSQAIGRWVGAGLFTTYVLFAATIISLATIEVLRPFKK